MSEQPIQKVTFTLRGDGITVTYSPSDGTMDVRGGADDTVRRFAGDEIVTTRDDFGILATTPIMEWWDGRVEFLTVAVPNGLPRSGAHRPRAERRLRAGHLPGANGFTGSGGFGGGGGGSGGEGGFGGDGSAWGSSAEQRGPGGTWGPPGSLP